MADPVSLASLFDGAEQAAMGGDFAAASRLLGEAARAQEAALGPDHLDLANTLNNLAVAHERCGQLGDAEREYRRAHAIAARTRSADDPLVTTSAQNLRDFCQANGRPVDAPPAGAGPVADAGRNAEAGSIADAGPVAGPVAGTAPVNPFDDAVTLRMPAPVFATSVDPPTAPIEPLALTLAGDTEAKGPAASAPPAQRAGFRAPDRSTAKPAARADTPAAPSSRRLSIPVMVALGAVVVLVIWLLAGRGPAAPPAEPQAAAPVTTAPAPAAARSTARPAPSPAATPAVSAATPTASAADGDVSVGDAQLCTALSGDYRCDPAGTTVRPGRLVFYTRLVATRDTSVVHRWYRGNELRQAIRLDVPARRQGFRTFSRGTVSAIDGEWRVELRTRDGQLLHAERFTVR